jgi:glycyl-tRNA synthetase beta chain
MAKHALLEIGAEELPSGYIEPARKQLNELAQKNLSELGLKYDAIKTFATPRRIALLIEGLVEKSEDRKEECNGPAVRVGKDAQGNFTQAAIGFASRFGIDPKALEVKTTDKGEYFFYTKKTPGEKTEKILIGLFPQLIKELYFPKTMKWEASDFRFARPIRTIIAMFGEKTLKFTLAGVKSANWTIGLHTVSAKKIIIKSPEKYMTTLRNNCIIAGPAERREIIKKIIEQTAKRAKGVVIADEELIDEVNYLVEHPVAVLADFDEKFLKLPPEVLITCLRKKQKCFAINSEKGALTNHFIGIRNGISEHQDIVREGYERVNTARLADSEFFYLNDRKTPLSDKAAKLNGVVFQQKLGSVADKMDRVRHVAEYINNLLKGTKDAADHACLDKTITIAKADLVTEMVFEYAELQGVMGRIYAKAGGEPAEVYKSVEEHYWPLTADGKLPTTATAIIISIADKMDTLAGDFAAGLLPSGSADPYGLRRAAVGIIRIIRECKLPLSITQLVDRAFAVVPESVKGNTAAKVQLNDFFRQRLENIYQAEGYRFDEVRAVLANGFDNLADVTAKLEALKAMRDSEDFTKLAAAFKRASNIIKQSQKANFVIPAAIDEQLLAEEAERNLFADVKKIEEDIKTLLGKSEYCEAMRKMVQIKPSVDGFFEKVMVMAEDEKIKANRLALISYLIGVFRSLLDFSQLQG